MFLDTPRFVAGFVPWAILALVLWMAWTVRDESRGTLPIILGIVLIPISGLVAVALQRDDSGSIPLTGLPLILLSMTLLAYGLAVVLLNSWSVREKAHPTALRIARLSLAVHVLAPCLALYFHVLAQDGMDETTFNAVFRFVLFLIVYGPLTASLTVPQTRSRSQALLALGLPLLFAALKAGTVGVDGLYGLLLHVAVVNVLAVWIALAGLALASLVTLHRPASWRPVALALGGAALSVALAWGALRRLGEDLIRLEELSRLDLLLWIALPALLVATDVLWGRAPSPFHRWKGRCHRIGPTQEAP